MSYKLREDPHLTHGQNQVQTPVSSEAPGENQSKPKKHNEKEKKIVGQKLNKPESKPKKEKEKKKKRRSKT